MATKNQWSYLNWTANTQPSFGILGSAVQNSNEGYLKQMVRMQTTYIVLQSASKIRSCNLPILSHTCSFQVNRSNLFGPFEFYNEDNTDMKTDCCLFTCLNIQMFYVEVTKKFQKKISIRAFQKILSRCGLRERFHSDIALHLTSKVFWWNQLHNYRDTEIPRFQKDRAEIYFTGSTTLWWITETPHWDEQTTLLQYRRI